MKIDFTPHLRPVLNYFTCHLRPVLNRRGAKYGCDLMETKFELTKMALNVEVELYLQFCKATGYLASCWVSCLLSFGQVYFDRD